RSEVNKSYEKLCNNLERKVVKYIMKNNLNPEWVKIDHVNNLEKISFNRLENVIANTRRNYFRYGISFDENFNLAFLEQEINGSALIRQLKNEKNALNNKNIMHYLKQTNSSTAIFMKDFYRNKDVYIFQ